MEVVRWRLWNQKGEGTLNYLKMFSGEEIPAASNQPLNYKSMMHKAEPVEPGAQATHTVGKTLGFPVQSTEFSPNRSK